MWVLSFLYDCVLADQIWSAHFLVRVRFLWALPRLFDFFEFCLLLTVWIIKLSSWRSFLASNFLILVPSEFKRTSEFRNTWFKLMQATITSFLVILYVNILKNLLCWLILGGYSTYKIIIIRYWRFYVYWVGLFFEVMRQEWLYMIYLVLFRLIG